MKTTSTPPAVRALALAALLAVPGLAAAQSTPGTQALNALKSRQTSLGLVADDMTDAAITSQYTDSRNGITHVYLRQRVQGIEVYGAVADVHLGQSGKVASLHSTFRPNVKAQARPAAASLSPEQAVAAAARALNMPAPSSLKLEKAGSGAEGMEFNNGGISLDKIPVKLMYLPMPDGSLRLVWDVTLAPLNGEHYWNARVDASTGALLDKSDYTISDSFSLLNLTRPLTVASAGAVTNQTTAQSPSPAIVNRTAAPNSYNVWPAPIESPAHGSRQLVVDPADPLASPFGWHDTDGKAGAESTQTRGNNVQAYDDRNNINMYRNNANISPNGGANLVFDFAFDDSPTAAPLSNVYAAVVNLFYWNNLMHDVMFRKGFDEVSGNFQVTNYSGEGKGGDDVQAEAQDASTTTTPQLNNANFTTPADGTRPRMQMYLWDKSVANAVVTEPANLAGPIDASEGAFTVPISKKGPISGSLVLVNDGTTTPTLGCNSYANAAQVQGNIAVVDRGDCSFDTKVRRAQTAGAKLVVIINNKPDDSPFGFVGDTTGIRIPGVMIGNADGNRIKQALRAGTTVKMSFSGQTELFYRDGDFDNGIIAHEYGHGISTRLTGGPAVSCLNSQEQMGEGWSDFFALWMTTKPGDIGATGRGIGTYASFQPTNGVGIRPTRYSTDLKINPTTYAALGTTDNGNYAVSSTGTVPVHNVGYVWCTALWDMNWALIEAEGYNPDLRGSTGGNNVALQLVIDGLKLQPCSPGFIDGRNAILKADSINYKGAHAAIIWRAFARRGMGFSASQGSSNSLTDQKVAFDMPSILSSSKQLNEQMMEVYPNPATNQITVRTQVGSSAPVRVELVSLLGQRVSVQTIAAARLQQEGLTVNTSALAGGVYVVRLTTSEGTITKKVVVQH